MLQRGWNMGGSITIVRPCACVADKSQKFWLVCDFVGINFGAN